MRTVPLLCAALCLGLATTLLPRGGAVSDPGRPAERGKPGPVEQLVRELGDEKFARREAASKKLEAIGEKALPELVEAMAVSRDLERRMRARRLVYRIMPKAAASKATGMKLARVEAGGLLMGSPKGEKHRRDDEPRHRVWINRPFYLGAHEVTQAEFEKVMKFNPSWFSPKGHGSNKVVNLATGRFPVEQVTWYDAVEFCNRLSKLDGLPAYYKLANVKKRGDAIVSATVTAAGGRGYRLPSEAEWEQACRAGTTTAFHHGEETQRDQANLKPTWVSGGYGGSPKWPDLGRTAKVGSYKPNKFGLYDMHGNVAEWCGDWYDKGYYAASPLDDPKGPARGLHKVMRGGSWLVLEGSARSASRLFQAPDQRRYMTGFRVARNP